MRKWGIDQWELWKMIENDNQKIRKRENEKMR